MKLLITSDKNQFILNQIRRVKGEDVKIPLGYFMTLGALSKSLVERVARDKVPTKGWSPEQLLAAVEKLPELVATTLETLTNHSTR